MRDVVGPNPIILVGTKMDLLPEMAHPRVRGVHQRAATSDGIFGCVH